MVPISQQWQEGRWKWQRHAEDAAYSGAPTYVHTYVRTECDHPEDAACAPMSYLGPSSANVRDGVCKIRVRET
jgi:hypothetical protein